jgi:hypothetical protein
MNTARANPACLSVRYSPLEAISGGKKNHLDHESV